MIKGRAVGVVYLDFSEAFDTVSCSILAARLVRSGSNKWTIRWVEIWLDRWAQRMVISSTKSSWQLMTSGKPQGSMPQLRLLMALFIMWTIQLSVCSTGPFQCKLFYGYFHLGIHRISRAEHKQMSGTENVLALLACKKHLFRNNA